MQGLWQNESFIYYFGSGGKGYKQYAPTNGAYEVNPSKCYFDWYATDEIVSITYDESNSFMSGSPSYYYEVDNDILVLVNTNYGDVSTYQRQ